MPGYDIIVIGASLGGLRAMSVLLPGLPADFPLPIVLVQHRHVDPNGSLSAVLQRWSALAVEEVEDKQEIRSGRVYLAPSDYHLLVEPGSFALSTEAPVAYARPSIDVLFESAASAYGERSVGVILTGANDDGSRGLLRLKQCGGLALVQEPATAECAVMPAAAIAAVRVDHILALALIAPFLVDLCRPESR
ncbi:MAG TPA: chemotaxis protein CheB [Roseiflexaceae bacterium]|nr:chemotaxis protein CheB [Roseiflexaceae bacterium]